MKRAPIIKMVEPLGANRIRVSFALGNIIEVKELTIPGASMKAHLVDMGVGLDPGNGREWSVFDVYDAPGKWLRRKTPYGIVIRT